MVLSPTTYPTSAKSWHTSKGEWRVNRTDDEGGSPYEDLEAELSPVPRPRAAVSTFGDSCQLLTAPTLRKSPCLDRWRACRSYSPNPMLLHAFSREPTGRRQKKTRHGPLR